jgi:hypothetical protein
MDLALPIIIELQQRAVKSRKKAWEESYFQKNNVFHKNNDYSVFA